MEGVVGARDDVGLGQSPVEEFSELWTC